MPAPRLLLIDDNEDILFMLRSMFQFKGYEVIIKDNVEAIPELVKELMPDVILMDMLLSGANGCEICKAIKEVPEITAIPIVMMSAMPSANIICLEAGANFFIDKPFEMEHMLNTVKSALEKPQS